MKFDLYERTSTYGENILKFAKTIPQNPIPLSLIIQLDKTVTSFGANCSEADREELKFDIFINYNKIKNKITHLMFDINLKLEIRI